MINKTDKQYFGRAGVNYFQTPGFENGNGDWSEFTTTYVNNIPTTITSGAANIATPASLIGVGGLRGSMGYYAIFTAATPGEGLISNIMTIDTVDRAKVLTVSFEYLISPGGNFNASGTSTQSVEVWIYDVTNSAWIQPAGYRGINQTNSGVNNLCGFFQCTFQTPSNGSQFRVALIVKNTVTCTISFDTFAFGPQSTVQGAAISDWASFTPTISTSTGAVSNATSTALWRRVGSDLEIVGSITFSAASSAFTDILVTVPSGISIDTTKSLAVKVGYATSYDSGISYFLADVLVNNASRVVIYGVDASPTRAALTNITNLNPFTFNANDTITYSYKVPVVGWSSQTVLSQDTDTRVISAQAACSTAFAYSATTPINFDTVVVDRAGSVTTSATAWKFTAPVTGDYRVSTNLLNGTGAISVNLYKNGSLFRQLMSVTTAAITSASTTISLNAGDYIDIRGASAATLVAGSTTNTISIERLSGPATIAASETVAAHYRRTLADGNQSLSSASSVVYFTGYYPSRVIDTHNFVTSSASDTYATIPISGVYEIVLTNRFDTTTATEVFQSYIMSGGTNQTGTLTIDGTQLSACITQTNTVGASGTAVYCGRFNAGDIVRFKMLRYAAVTTNLIGTNFSGFTIKRVGT